MLDVLSKPEEYQKRMAELQSFLTAVEARLSLYKTLEKVEAYHKQVKDEAASASKSRKDAEALWDKVHQASESVAARTAELNAYKVELDEQHMIRTNTLAKDIRVHLADRAEYDAAVASLHEAQAKLKDNQARYDADKLQYKEKLDALHIAMQNVLAP